MLRNFSNAVYIKDIKVPYFNLCIKFKTSAKRPSHMKTASVKNEEGVI
jgi:hypothetical protein